MNVANQQFHIKSQIKLMHIYFKSYVPSSYTRMHYAYPYLLKFYLAPPGDHHHHPQFEESQQGFRMVCGFVLRIDIDFGVCHYIYVSTCLWLCSSKLEVQLLPLRSLTCRRVSTVVSGAHWDTIVEHDAFSHSRPFFVLRIHIRHMQQGFSFTKCEHTTLT